MDNDADESVKQACGKREGAALIALLRTKPETLAGCLASLRYVANWVENNNAGLFHAWDDPQQSVGGAFLSDDR